MALAPGKSAIRGGPLTLHTKTAIHIAQLLTEVKTNSNGNFAKHKFLGQVYGEGRRSRNIDRV